MSNYTNFWAEIMFFVLLVIGFIFSVSAPSTFLSYLMILACGMMAGRLFIFRRKNVIAPYIIIIVGFAIGYLIGAYYGNKLIIILLFTLGLSVSYYLHSKNIIRDIPF